MGLDDLRHKLQYLTEHCPKELETALSIITPANMPTLSLDLVYAVIVNQRWLKAPLFVEALSEMLASTHQIERRRATRLAEAATAKARDLLSEKRTLIEQNDQEFLRYILVSMYSADDEQALLRNLGLGRGLLDKIRAVMMTVLPSQHADDSSVREDTDCLSFVPEIDAQIESTLLDLAKELATNKQGTDKHQLRYLLCEIEQPWRELLATSGVDWLFELLVTMGHGRGLYVRQIRAYLAKNLADQLGVDWKRLAGNLMTSLHRHELTFQVSGHGEAARWQLLPRAEQLTAAAVIADWLDSSNQQWDPLSQIKDLPAAYQVQLIRSTPSLDLDTLERLLREIRPLSPQGFNAALRRLAADTNTAHALQIAREIATNDPSIWLRKSAQAALTRLSSA